jgi:subtilase family serine protease
VAQGGRIAKEARYYHMPETIPFENANFHGLNAKDTVLRMLKQTAGHLALLAIGLILSASQIQAQAVRRIPGHIHPLAQAQNERGHMDPTMRLSYMSLFIKRSDTKQRELEELLEKQQDQRSSLYHHWLTPEEFADRFGADQTDIDRLTGWLQSNGFSVLQVARGRDFIVFTGTVQQVESGLRTEIHRFSVEGETHYANTSEPSVPEVLAPLVAGFRGLNDFKVKAMKRPSPLLPISLSSAKPKLDLLTKNFGNVVSPDDLATIYNLNPLYRTGIDGRGQTIAIAGATDIYMSDIENFRAAFNLPFNNPRKILVPGSDDPGITGDLGEADLDLEWSGALARNASVLFVYSTDAFASALYAIDQNLAPVLSLSYGECELHTVTSDVQVLAAEAQKAAAEGITWVVSSGDSGSAGCERQSGPFSQAITRMNPNFPASLPYVTAVGGLEFNEGNGNYWSSASSQNPGSALGYIPEASWNDEDFMSQQRISGFASSGGGASWLFPKPTWQSGPGVPTDNARDVPDVALTASWFHDPYVLFTDGGVEPNGGTSAAAPAFAGIIALVNQYLTTVGGINKPGLGLINPMLYSLARTAPSAFHDVAVGSNVVPCVPRSTQDCTNGFMGYNAGPGYDLVTGLGSVDAYNLALSWRANLTKTSRLAITKFTTSTSAKVAGSFSLSLDVANQGDLDADPFTVGIYFTTDGTTATKKSDYIYCDVKGLVAGSTGTCSGSVNLGPSITPGVYVLLGVADVNNAVPQTDRSASVAKASTGPVTVTP